MTFSYDTRCRNEGIIQNKYIILHIYTCDLNGGLPGKIVSLMKKILCRSVATRLQQPCGEGILCQRTVPIFAASGKVMANNFATSGKLP